MNTKLESSYRLSIDGMSCQRCVASVEKAVTALPGVSRVVVDLQGASAAITGGNADEAVSAVRQAGYDAELISEDVPSIPVSLPVLQPVPAAQRPVEKIEGGYQLAVQDMTCASCVAAVERAIHAVPGVTEAAVNLVEKRAQVVGGSPQAVAQAVIDQGYGAYLLESQTDSNQLQLGFQALDQVTQQVALEQLFTRLDPQASFEFKDALWHLQTSLHPADLLIELEQQGYQASFKETYDDPYAEEASAAAKEIRRSWQRAALAGVVGIGLMVAEMTGNTTQVTAPGGQSYWLAVAIICFLVMRFSGGHYYLGALKQLKHRSANMDTLIALGTGSAWLSSLVIVLQPEGMVLQGEKLYFDASVLILAFLQLGHGLETRAKRTTSEAVGSLVGLAPKQAEVVRDQGSATIPVSLLSIGDLIQVRPGDKIPIDGEVVEGISSVDEAMLTGESLPQKKQPGDPLIGGSVNRSGQLRFKVTRLGEETTLAHIIAMVRQAQMSKPEIGRLVDRVSAVFVPVVVLIAVAAFLVWLLVGPTPPLSYALTAGIAVLVIACPCALGLATPIAIMVGTSRAAQMNVLIRNSDGLQSASRLTHLVVDKTGTLTQGAPKVTDLHAENLPEAEMLALAGAVEAVSSHPLAEAILDHLRQQGIVMPEVIDFHNHEGLGVEGRVAGKLVQLGGSQYLKQLKITPSEPFLNVANQQSAEAGSLVWVVVEGQLSGLLVLRDPLRSDSAAAVKSIQDQGVEVIICSGDNDRAVEAVAASLGIKQAHSELLPEQKLEVVKSLQQQGNRVGMVGDGVNDAPALAQADTGFAIGSGTDVAIEHADITLVGDSLLNVSTAIGISRATIRNIKQNLFGAFVYNMIGIPMAAGLLYPVTGWLLPPMFASVAMAMSSVTVVINANRLRFYGPMTTTLRVTGMTCPHCVNNVQKALLEVPGVDRAEVALEEATAVVSGSAKAATLVQAVVDAGYAAESDS
ncbi:MAG: heavy metal translocating P-type ATPase [Candidatus Thiodiazotropha weberae]|nr:heavy metal translocating P-type ATPase [Candidatus Thiodiazotropha lotti]MCG8013775.1 heavy metal translocating P-type ATPase [Candidatus Thiodiazotropha lotti]MCG8019529.1 heavy metal translocating P-type ATPase [Candidatus Thiodiazotropha lotti]MCW4206691.1 heavy metal translocating P-type ATPase [Candidatus Thiodiazotropha lotti]MCW4213253.1 heavy metal translocating P-type ATPase [Candidatus Thiodiazotropha lotti]